MKCPDCGAVSEVMETRVFRTVFTRRRRQCFNEHSFYSYEVPVDYLALDRLPPEPAVGNEGLSIAERIYRAAERKRMVLAQPAVPAAKLAAQLDCSIDNVRKIRRNGPQPLR